MCFLFLVLAVMAAFTAASVNAQAPAENQGKPMSLLGINPKDAKLYSGPTFTCPGSGKVIPIEQVNDDFCDCPFVKGVTVTDEPGTGACQNGIFYCVNRKFRPETLPASRINDGVCDCCDGSDEWKEVGGIKCPSECASLGEKIYEEEKAQLEALGNALKARRELASKAQKDLNALRSELKRLKYGVNLPTPKAVQSVVNIKLGTDEILDEELNKVTMYETEDEGEEERPHDDELERNDEDDRDLGEPIVADEDIPPEEEEELNDDENRDNSDDENDNDNDDFDSDSDSDSDSDNDDELTFFKIVAKAFKKLGRSIKKGVGKFLFGRSGRYPSLSERIKWPFRYASAKIQNVVQGKPMPKGIEKYKLGPKPKKEVIQQERKNKDRIREIEKILDIDFDEDKCFYSMYDNCTSVNNGQYEYKVCPFKSGSQSSTNLGKWDSWKDAKSSGSAYVMLYNGGTRCFNGVERSLTVIVECGPEYKAIEASEPAMCEYQMRITSPCACSQTEYDNLLKNIKELEDEMKE